MIVPRQDFEFAVAARCNYIDIWPLPHSPSQHIVGRKRSGTRCLHALRPQQAAHAKTIQYRLIETVRRQLAKSCEIGLTFKLERPSHDRLQFGVFTLSELNCAI